VVSAAVIPVRSNNWLTWFVTAVRQIRAELGRHKDSFRDSLMLYL
jgi:hypothetical protein